MDCLHEPARRIPVAYECDICVVGGSCTGVFAAVAAARLGARVALVEKNGFFGGVATAALVSIWHSLLDTSGQQQIIAGLTQEMLDRLRKRGGVYSPPGVSNLNAYVLHTPELTIELDSLVLEAGVRPFLHCNFSSVIAAEGNISAIIIEDKNGRRAIRARHFIDATGDGDVVLRAGCETYTPEHVQPPTTCAVVEGLAEVKRHNPSFHLARAVFDSANSEALPPGTLWSAPVPGSNDRTMVAGTRVFGANCADAEQLTRAEMDGRRQVRAICDILKKASPSTDHVPLVSLPACIGIRETRHAVCRHRLEMPEILHGIRFPDAVVNGTYRVDIHHADGPGITFLYLDGRKVVSTPDTEEESRWLAAGQEAATFYQVPYRALLPKGIHNLLTAGRSIDADQGAFGAVRVMVNCNQMGQAAGTAAFIALDTDATAPEVPAERLRKVLADTGCVVL